jgi:hypothetical protein
MDKGKIAKKIHVNGEYVKQKRARIKNVRNPV